MDDLTPIIKRRKRQDFLVMLLGIVCTLVGVLTLGALLIDLCLDGLARVKTVSAVLKEDGRTVEGTVVREDPDRITIMGADDKQQDIVLADVEALERGSEFRLWRFLTSYPSRRAYAAGILSAWIGTLLVMLVTAAAAVPLGVAAGVYLEEYAPKNWLTSFIEINISNLAGVPSIVYGLMALGLLVYQLHFGESIAAAGVTLALLILPIVIVATREALRSIPQSIREAAYALGSTKWQVVRHHLLPYSTGGISTGVIIGLSRAIGETAPLITIGALTFIAFLPPSPVQASPPFVSAEWIWSPYTVLPIQMFNWVSRPGNDFHANAAAAGLVLMTVTLSMNALAIAIRYRMRKRIRW